MALIGAVALVAGLLSVLFGVDLVPDSAGASASVDSEMRFYAVWYAAAGLIVLRAARRVEASAGTIRGLAAGFFVAGCARVISWVVVGRPHDLQLVLLVLELALPLILVPWQSAVARATPSERNRASARG